MSCKLCSNKHTQWNVLSCGHFFGASCIEKQGCFEFVSKEEHADCINWFHSTAPAMSHYIYKCGIKVYCLIFLVFSFLSSHIINTQGVGY